MALVNPEEIALQSRGFQNLTWLRQIGLMIGLAASIAIGIGIAMWSQTPDYRLLYSNLNEQDANAVVQALQQAGIKYQLSSDASTVMVPQNQVHNARLKLAGQGLPKGVGAGFELLDKNQGFGVSQFMEKARYQRALEGELARTISSINSVRSARVHLAIPKRSAFVRARKKPTASVTVDLYAGRSLNEEQVAAIGHMVAASVPDMEVEQVSIIDQKGRLLTTPGMEDGLRITATQFAHRKQVEDYYINRIEDILTPIMGMGAVQAQVSADIDFTMTETTRESYDPELSAVRSEQTSEEKTSTPVKSLGIPGSLANQPQADKALAAEGEGAMSSEAVPESSSRQVTRNYELDRTISHIRAGGAAIKRLSVAVVVDNKIALNEDGEQVSTPLSEEEINRLTTLVKDAIGFDRERGDTVSVINSAFSIPEPVEELPEPSFLEGEGIWNIAKQALVIVLIGFLIFGVLKPVMRDLAAKGKALPQPQSALPGSYAAAGGGELGEDQLTLSGPQQGAPQLANGGDAYENNLNTAKSLASQDPKRVAQVVNNWVVNE